MEIERINEMLADLDGIRIRLACYRNEIVGAERSAEPPNFFAVEAAGNLASSERVVTDAAITLQIAYTAPYRMSWQREEPKESDAD